MSDLGIRREGVFQDREAAQKAKKEALDAGFPTIGGQDPIEGTTELPVTCIGVDPDRVDEFDDIMRKNGATTVR